MPSKFNYGLGGVAGIAGVALVPLELKIIAPFFHEESVATRATLCEKSARAD